MIRIAPSILSADFARLGEELTQIAAAGADLIHLDVMDGHFVPNLTIGAPIVRALRKHTDLPFDCHLMIERPQNLIGDFLEAGANMISVHVEAVPHLHRVLTSIREGGAMAGIAINPATSLESVVDALEYCDYVLVMSVNPGFGGQRFISGTVEKIRRLSSLIESRGLNVGIEVDGGIDPATAPEVVVSGARILVAGSAIFGKKDRAAAIEEIRSAARTSRT